MHLLDRVSTIPGVMKPFQTLDTFILLKSVTHAFSYIKKYSGGMDIYALTCFALAVSCGKLQPIIINLSKKRVSKRVPKMFSNHFLITAF